MDEAPITQYPQLEDFCDYMTSTWVDTCAKFPVPLWNQFDNLDERVYNKNEAYNSRFNKRSGPTAHPNVWKFCDVLQQEEFSLVQVRYESLVQGNFKSKGRNKIDLQRDMDLLKAKIKFLNSTKALEDYVTLLGSSS